MSTNIRMTGFAIIFIILIIISSIFVAKVSNLINVDVDTKLTQKINTNNLNNDKWNKQQINYRIDDSPEHLMWFIQITDIHISIIKDSDRIKNLEEFCTVTIDNIKPQVVVCSGDLTDASKLYLQSGQHEQEWKIYEDILIKSKIKEKTLWLDIRGNHDNFNVPGINTSTNYYSKYSVQGKEHPRSYMRQLKKGNEKYTFIGVDACLEPGPKRPFNFFGYLKEEDKEQIINLMNDARNQGSNYTIWFGHYPTSCILTAGTDSNGIRGIIGQYNDGIAYLSGHLHTMGGLVSKMYTLHKDGFLELELGDWKHNRMYRVAAIDHGLFSFTDIKHNEWPVVIITNPKNTLFNIPTRENLNLQIDSTHIRILAFSISDIIECRIKIDTDKWNECYGVTKNLFVKKWKPDMYKKGIHTIEVIIKDHLGNFKHIKQTFSLDGSRIGFGILPRFILMTDLYYVLKLIFLFSFLICVLPLCFFKAWHILTKNGHLKRPRIRCKSLRNFVRTFWIISTINRLFYPIIIYCLYITIGPWSFVKIIDDHIGVVFSWGIIVKGTYLPSSLTFLYGSFQLLMGQFPLIVILSKNTDRRFRQTQLEEYADSTNINLYKQICTHLPFIIIITLEILLALFFWHTYGFLSLFLCPIRLWSVFLNIYLWKQTLYLTDEDLQFASVIWQTNRKITDSDAD